MYNNCHEKNQYATQKKLRKMWKGRLKTTTFFTTFANQCQELKKRNAVKKKQKNYKSEGEVGILRVARGGCQMVSYIGRDDYVVG